MHKILTNNQIAQDVYLMTVEGTFEGRMGQFYMLRAWTHYPVLSRPISIYNLEPDSIQFLYKVGGEGTARFASLRPGDSIQLEGPFGNGFPEVDGKTALVGGGIGIAPLLYTAKQLDKPDIYLGFRGTSYMTEAFAPYANELVVRVDANLLLDVDMMKYDNIFVCGPLGMMEAAARMAEGVETKLYVSLEKRMACGIGACYGCSVRTPSGNRKVCSEGPVFQAQEVTWHEKLSV